MLVRVLHQDLAYDGEIIPQPKAESLADEFLAHASGESCVLFTNGHGNAWNPATKATFDKGVVAVGNTWSACVWVEDEFAPISAWPVSAIRV